MESSSKVNPSPSFLAIITAGLITGVLQVVLSSSYAALIYGGKLSPYLGQGIGFALIGAFTIATTIAIFAARPGTVGSNQDVPVAIFSLISVSIVASMPACSATAIRGSRAAIIHTPTTRIHILWHCQSFIQ